MKFFVIAMLTALMFFTATCAEAKHLNLNSKYKIQNQKVFIFYPHDLRWAAYENGHKIKSGIANGGKPGHRTPVGVFRVLDRKGPNYLSTRYPINANGTRGGAQMPYAMHFTKAGHAIHGSPEISNQNSSHGCIRVKTKAARWLNHHFMTPGTKVIVYPY